MDRKQKVVTGAVIGAAAAGGAIAAHRRRAATAEVTDRLEAAGRKPRVVVLGAGFGGLRTAMGLCRRSGARNPVDVTVVDRHNYQLFTPMLYHVASGLIDPAHIAFPVRTVARKHGFRFIERAVLGVDLAQKRVLLEGMDLE